MSRGMNRLFLLGVALECAVGKGARRPPAVRQSRWSFISAKCRSGLTIWDGGGLRIADCGLRIAVPEPGPEAAIRTRRVTDDRLLQRPPLSGARDLVGVGAHQTDSD